MRRRSLLVGAAAILASPARAAGMQRVRLVIAAGAIDIELYGAQAPVSVTDFLRYVDAHSYDGGAFSRVVRADNDHGAARIDVVQGGARKDAPKLPPIAHESTKMTGLRHVDGTISLPRDGVGTGSGAEFFICVGDQPSLDFGGARNKDGQGFAAFGQVRAGMALVRDIWRMDARGAADDPYVAGQMLTHPVQILSAGRV